MGARILAADTRGTDTHGDAPVVTPEELLAGSEMTYEVEIPLAVLRPSPNGAPTPAVADLTPRGGRVRLRPLTVRDVQLIAKAAKTDEVLTSILMIQRAVVDPPLNEREVAQMHGGLVRFLVDRINRISGLTAADDELRAVADSPLVQAFVVLAKEFGWTPDQIKTMTVGQILGYLEVLNQSRRGG